MRTIKFRGRNQKRVWIIGELLTLDGRKYIKPMDVNLSELMSDSSTYEVEENTIGQFIGAYDNDKMPIYEGDIIKVHIPCNAIGKDEVRYRKVVYNEKDCVFEFVNNRDCCICDIMGAKNGVVEYFVIGNMYDKPSLLQNNETSE